MVRVQNKLNVPNIVCGVRIRPFGTKVIDRDLQDREIQEKINCGSICVIDMGNTNDKNTKKVTYIRTTKDNGIIAIDESTPIVVQDKPTTTKRKRKTTNSTTTDK